MNYEINVIPTIENVDFNRDYLFTDLDCFKVSPNNRPSDFKDSTVKKYYKMMKNGEWFFEISPIYVGISNLMIENGEHRRKAVKMMNNDGFKPIVHIRFFDDTDPEKLKKYREALNGGKHWNADDYVEALVESGVEEFVFLKEFCTDPDHPQLNNGKNKKFYNKGAIVLGATYPEFKKAYMSGKWNIPKKDIASAERRYCEIVRIKKALKLDETSQDCWIPIAEAWYEISNDAELMLRIKNLPEGIESFYESLKYSDNGNDSKTIVWYQRFIEAIKRAER